MQQAVCSSVLLGLLFADLLLTYKVLSLASALLFYTLSLREYIHTPDAAIIYVVN